jgi:hypothetical protein
MAVLVFEGGTVYRVMMMDRSAMAKAESQNKAVLILMVNAAVLS